MSGVNTTSDIVSAVLKRCGENSDGSSLFQDRVINYVNEAQLAAIAGGSEFGPDIDDPWAWALSTYPVVITLEPPYKTGSVSLTKNSVSATFSSAPTNSLEGWFLKIQDRNEFFRIVQHTAGATAFTIDQPYPKETGATLSFEALKLEYDLSDDLIVINSSNNRIDFQESAGSELNATLAVGGYTPSNLATEIKTQLDAAGGETYTVTFDSITRKFTISHGGSFLQLSFGDGTNVPLSAAKVLGYPESNQTGSVSYTSTESVNAILRLVAPLVTYDYDERSATEEGSIDLVAHTEFIKNYPLTRLHNRIPDYATIIREKSNGIKTVRFNGYVETATRVEVPFIPYPVPLGNTASSYPIIPQSHRSFLVYAASYWLMKDKSDNRAADNFQLAKEKLRAMQNQHRKTSELGSKYYAKMIPRRDSHPRRYPRKAY
jgi:hypothetical protein